MKRRTLIQVLYVSLLFAGIISNQACKSTANSPEFLTDSLVAHFDNFFYKGDDIYYNENPLPGEDFFYNPVLPGWYSDPSICTNGEDYFMVTSTFSYFPGVPIFHSSDLMNWKQIGHVLNREEQLLLEGQKVSKGIFAPAISYNPLNKTYYMITTNVGHGNFFVKTKDPFGEWSDPIWLPDVHGIDPSFLFDDDGKAYIVNNDEPDGGSTYEGHRAIRIIEFDVDSNKTIGKSKMIVNGGVDLSEKPIWIEGPHLYNIFGSYFLMCAEGGTSVNHREVVFKSDSPFGKFEPWDNNPILTQKHLAEDRAFPVTCAGHADLIKKRNGQWWAVFLACRPIENQFENLGRETFIMPVSWSKDGFPYITGGNEVLPRIVQMDGVKRADEVTFGNFEKTDEFDSPKLDHEWLTLRGDAKEHYSLTDNPGFLTLNCADVSSSELKSPAFVGRRLQHHTFECSTRMYFSPETESESAGLLLMKDETHQYQLLVEKAEDQTQISLTKLSEDKLETIQKNFIEPEESAIQLKIKSDGYTFSFFYATQDKDWLLLADNVDASYLSTANSWGFTGTTVGMYASNSQ